MGVQTADSVLISFRNVFLGQALSTDLVVRIVLFPSTDACRLSVPDACFSRIPAPFLSVPWLPVSFPVCTFDIRSEAGHSCRSSSLCTPRGPGTPAALQSDVLASVAVSSSCSPRSHYYHHRVMAVEIRLE